MSVLRAKIFFTLWLLVILFVEIFVVVNQVSGGIGSYIGVSKVLERGLILDRNGKELALNIKRKSLALNPKLIGSEEEYKIVNVLSKEINLSKKELKEKLNHKSEFIWIKRMLSQEEYNRISKYLDGRKIFVVEEPYRAYPLKLGSSNLLGLVGVDTQGLYGLEASLDYYLKKGHNITLTIDKDLQEISANYLKGYINEYEAKAGFLGILDLNTGEILALVSLPDIDPTKSLSDIIEQLKKIKSPLYSVYEPGSLFKVITAGIALEEKLIDSSSFLLCKGEEIVDGYKVRCPEVHGKVNLTEAIVKSCNIYFYHLAQKIPVSIWKRYFNLLGIYELIPLDVKFLPNDSIVPNFEESIVTRGTMGFGHGLAMNPVKILWMLSVFGNEGYLIRPKLIKSVNENKEIYRQVFSKETSNELLKMMSEVVKRGTARNLSPLKYNIAGKTGTAQISTSQGYIDLYNHFFVGYLFLGGKKYCILIMLEAPKRGRFARETVVPLFGEVIKRLAIYGRIIN